VTVVKVRVEIHQRGIQQLVSGPRSPVVRHMTRVGAATTTVAQTLVGVNTGRLRQAIGFTVTPLPPTRVRTRVSANTNYAMVHHQGHKVIRPRRAKLLRWKNKRGEYVFAKKVRAVAGTKFLTRAVQAVTGKRVRKPRS
jgi:hypothetical protein